MKKFFLSIMALALCVSAFAEESKEASKEAAKETPSHFKIYGFVRNYFAYDSRESVAGSEDFFYYLPKDEKIVNGEDLNAVSSFRFAALTTRLGLDVLGYQIGSTRIGAKIEADFYAGLSGSTGTATFRLRQAYMTLGWNAISMKIGQAWHPMAADMPHIMSLNSGAPFGPFSRTPQVTADFKLSKNFSLTASALWQMQYCSTGPDGASANYIKWGCTPEFYLGANVTAGGFLGRVGVDVLSIKPRRYNELGTAKVSDRLTTVSPYLYLQYNKGKFSAKGKTILAQAGEHFNLNGGYGISGINSDGSWNYCPTRNSSSWVSLSYGKKWQGVLFGGYVRNFGTRETVSVLYFSKNSFANMNRMWRLTPGCIYNAGKFQLGLEYEITGVQYGSIDLTANYYGLATKDLHWVTNNRVLMTVKFNF